MCCQKASSGNTFLNHKGNVIHEELSGIAPSNNEWLFRYDIKSGNFPEIRMWHWCPGLDRIASTSVLVFQNQPKNIHVIKQINVVLFNYYSIFSTQVHFIFVRY